MGVDCGSLSPVNPPAVPLPRLTDARCALTREVQVLDAEGAARTIHIPDERALTIYVDRRELVTLMTLGQHPERLVLGYLLNQGLVAGAGEIESISVDWDVGAAAVKSRAGLEGLDERTARRVVTTGCGQGTVFGDMLAGAEAAQLPAAADSAVELADLVAIGEVMRSQPSVYRLAGSVHGTALWRVGTTAPEQLFFCEDVGRHNAVDTIAGWMAVQGVAGAGLLLYTTGRLTSEMVLKAARLGVPVLVSRNGVTAMGHALAERIGMTLAGRAAGRRLLIYSGRARVRGLPAPASAQTP
jgi:FdhD protein